MNQTTSNSEIGFLAKQWCNRTLPLEVLRSAAGWYIGTMSEDGPCSRESVEYWKTEVAAQAALENGKWTQKETP